MAKRTIIRNGLFLTFPEGEDGPSIQEGTLIMQAGRIQSIGNAGIEWQEKDEVIDGRGKLFMPGLVNTHTHAGMSLLRSVKNDVALQEWLQVYMWPLEAKFTAEDVRIGTELAIVEMLKSGTTTFLDMYDHMDQAAQAVEASGIRACLTRGVIGIGCSEEVQEAKLKEAIQFVRNWNQAAEGRITAVLAPHAPYTCPPPLMEKFVDAAHELDVPLHTHLSETAKEVEDHVQAYGVRPVEHLLKLGVFSRPALIAHGVHLTDEEIAILAEHQVGVSHNPGSNLILASGVARVPAMLKAGVRVSLGTDSAASNNNLDLFEEMRLAALIHKGVSGDPTVVPAAAALAMGTVEGARALWLNDVGTLQPGSKADLIAVDVTAPHFQPATNLVSHLIYAASGADVTDVWVDGKQLVRNRECLTMDEERIRYEANRAIQRLRG